MSYEVVLILLASRQLIRKHVRDVNLEDGGVLEWNERECN